MEKTKQASKTEIMPLAKTDPWLENFNDKIHNRYKRANQLIETLSNKYGSLYDFAVGHLKFGIHYEAKAKGWRYTEWAPEATALHLIGDFNEWNRTATPLERKENGTWEVFLPENKFSGLFEHASKLKVLVKAANGSVERIPSYIRRVVQDPISHDFVGQYWQPDHAFDWQGVTSPLPNTEQPIIYEAHIGMAQEKEGLGTYREFADLILPRVKANGYNTIQLMAIQEHPYYGSFGYHVSSFFAPSSRFGTPEDLKYLIRTAHKAGIAVVMDIVHSHAVKNILEGLNLFDGTVYQYFHEGGKGEHPDWDSKLFNYGKWEVIQFLLSNIRYWLEEFHFDGFRFDGVSSMMYLHHGHTSFETYDKYFDKGADEEAICYLQLANKLIKTINPSALSIAEDVSGMPGLCRPLEDGGIGFDYRLGMGIPDFWIKQLKEKQDEDWNPWEIFHVLTNRRENEGTIAYAESHDQALVGDKTIAFRLMDKEMYFHMLKEDDNLAVERGLALHKMIRLITITLGGEAYLNFMGNEFGHPEWIDFPRQGNQWSYKYARRQWSLVDNPDLKYHYLNVFDRDMIGFVKKANMLSAKSQEVLNIDEANNVIICKRAEKILIFNFHPTRSIPDYKFFAGGAGTYQIVLNTDDKKYGGFGRIEAEVTYPTDKTNMLQMYITNRTAIVLEKLAEDVQ